MSVVIFCAVMTCGLVGKGQQMEAECSSKIMVPNYKSTRRHNLEHQQRQECSYINDFLEWN
jgi:hypothetical protein